MPLVTQYGYTGGARNDEKKIGKEEIVLQAAGVPAMIYPNPLRTYIESVVTEP